MSLSRESSRRDFLQSFSLASAALAIPHRQRRYLFSSVSPELHPLEEFRYGDVHLDSPIHEEQLQQTHAILMNLSDDSLLKPFRQMIGQAAPGEDLGGWYRYDPDYDWHTGDAGFAPSATFGQWVSALARTYAITGSTAAREKVLRLNRLYAKVIAGEFYENNRFPAYCYDKLVCGLVDSHRHVGDPDALAILQKTTDTALPHLPKHSIERGQNWRPGKDESYTWDESYTISENLFLAYQRGAGDRYRELGLQYLDDDYFGPLSEGRNNLAGRHAYSHVNALCSAMQAYMTVGNEKYLHAAKNGFDMLAAQSFATGGWGPDETLRAPGSSDVYDSLTKTHNSFETPCGAYAHFKLTRYLLRVTRDPRYGDSMERMMYNTILGAKPLQPDGRTFYYSDYNFDGKKVYKEAPWPCCSGTMPQIAADYRISTYFRDLGGIYVNLYIPSTLQWLQDGASFTLKLTAAYPLASPLQFELQTTNSKMFALNFRIPAWTEAPTLLVNGKHTGASVLPGTFATIEREWKNGDRIELDLSMKTRLEPINKRHADTVALLYGPLVLFGVNANGRTFTRAELLAAEQASPNSWQAGSPVNPLVLRPFFALASQPYSTYLKLS